MRHYCDGCNLGSYDEDAHPEEEYCCGGDGECDAVEPEPKCIDGDGHEWEPYGGCRENPGVWSVGGTALEYHERCGRCGWVKISCIYGWQRNPGQCDSVRYERGEPDPPEDEDYEEDEEDEEDEDDN